MAGTSHRLARARSGFTIMEALIVIILLGIIGTMAVPSIAESMTATRVDRAAATIARDIEAAFSLAARERKPVRLVVDSLNMRIRVEERATSTALQTHFYSLSESDYGLTRLAPSVATITIFPSGLASSAFVIFAAANQARRAIRVRRTGHIWVTSP